MSLFQLSYHATGHKMPPKHCCPVVSPLNLAQGPKSPRAICTVYHIPHVIPTSHSTLKRSLVKMQNAMDYFNSSVQDCSARLIPLRVLLTMVLQFIRVISPLSLLWEPLTTSSIPVGVVSCPRLLAIIYTSALPVSMPVPAVAAAAGGVVVPPESTSPRPWFGIPEESVSVSPLSCCSIHRSQDLFQSPSQGPTQSEEDAGFEVPAAQSSGSLPS
mmetsp:Transcript_29535/g.35875  ORF Transcript_29535/g.35875 Transcript_29535/m.35875 type:complete len:215 (-) Transcript_29535:2182-2826(-)